jgi:hypothetical protein
MRRLVFCCISAFVGFKKALDGDCSSAAGRDMPSDSESLLKTVRCGCQAKERAERALRPVRKGQSASLPALGGGGVHFDRHCGGWFYGPTFPSLWFG